MLAKAIEIQTPTPGFAVQIYVADHIELELPYGDSTPLSARGWQGPVGASADVHDGERIPLTLAGRPYRYYLVWLTTLPPGTRVGDDRRADAVQVAPTGRLLARGSVAVGALARRGAPAPSRQRRSRSSG